MTRSGKVAVELLDGRPGNRVDEQQGVVELAAILDGFFPFLPGDGPKEGVGGRFVDRYPRVGVPAFVDNVGFGGFAFADADLHPGRGQVGGQQGCGDE